MAVLIISHEIWTTPIITSWNFRKNILDLMKSLENLHCSYYREVKFSQKIMQFCWCDLKIWPTPIIRSWNFCKNKAVLMMSLEKLNWPYYKEMKFSQKYPRFNEVTWKFELPLLTGGKSSTKIWQFCWCDLKIWPAPIITRENICKNKAILMTSLKNLNCPCYHELKFLQKYTRFIEHFNCPHYHFFKYKVVLMTSLENLAFPYYHKVKFSLK